jgi:hypothetical protein
MGEFKLHQMSEQRCKPFGCAVVRCIMDNQGQECVREAYEKLNECIKREKKNILSE